MKTKFWAALNQPPGYLSLPTSQIKVLVITGAAVLDQLDPDLGGQAFLQDVLVEHSSQVQSRLEVQKHGNAFHQQRVSQDKAHCLSLRLLSGLSLEE